MCLYSNKLLYKAYFGDYIKEVSIQALEHTTADNLHITRQLRIEDKWPEMLTEKSKISLDNRDSKYFVNLINNRIYKQVMRLFFG